MSPIHFFQYLIYSLCIYAFTVFIYITFYSDILISNEHVQLCYDFIIVGAGTAGSLVAHRIALETNFSYVLLEAGVRSNALLEIPVLGPLLHGSVHDWQFETVPQENGCFAVNNKITNLLGSRIVVKYHAIRSHASLVMILPTCWLLTTFNLLNNLPYIVNELPNLELGKMFCLLNYNESIPKCKLIQGKIVGGSSKLSNMIHIRGNITHYLEWFQGKYTEKYIEQQFDHIERDMIQLDEIRYQSKLADAILEAAKELNYENIGSKKQFHKGFMRSKVTQRNGRRWTTSDKIVNSQHLVTNTFVEKVLFKEKKVAFGVIIQKNGLKYAIKARRGVILSAGAINTPKILQLSGIGPSDVLKPLNISIVKDLDVGMNLQDHVTTGLDLVAFNMPLNISPTNMMNPLHILDYFIKGKGPLTSPGCEVVGFLSTKNSTVPDIQFMVLPVGLTSDRGVSLRKSIGITDDVWKKYFVPSFGMSTATILPILLHPKSRGEVYITSSDPTVPPAVNPNYFSSQDDIETIVEGLKLVQEFVQSKAMTSIGAYLNPKPFPGCKSYLLFSDGYWKCYIKHLTLSVYHYVGTCKMGSPKSRDTVVDTNFRVIGVKRLFVADGSVLPALPSGNINAAIALMANVFFESVIMPKKVKILSCDSNEWWYAYMFKVCALNR